MNRRSILILTAVVALVGGGLLVGEIVQAQGVPIGPCPPGWICECNSTVVEDIHCPLGNGEQGNVVVTVCLECPPPDCDEQTGACRIFPCEYDVSATCR